MRTDTAYEHWGTRWASADSRTEWLKPEATVAFTAEALRTDGVQMALDLGTGVGRHALMLAELGYEVSAMDAAPQGLDVLRHQAARAGLSIRTDQALMTDLPYADAQFDYVLAFNVIYHGDPEIVRASIAEIRRVLKPGGVYQGTMLSKRNANFGLGREVAPDTWVIDGVSDKAHPHFYCSAAELVELFHGFELLSLEDRLHSKPGSWHWHMKAERAA